MEVYPGYQLKKYNTFGISAVAKYFTEFASVEELQEVLENYPNEPRLILGGGSNVLFTGNYNGIVLKNNINGITVSGEDDQHVFVTSGAGVNWQELVSYCVNRNLAGIENLSLIPGNAGASPLQNIGAYGVELANVFHELQAYHLGEKKIIKFSAPDCEFGYRESVFKKKYKDHFAILTITIRLSKTPVFNISYAALQQELEKINPAELTTQLICNAVIKIRKNKLPDPGIIGNAGSFFKNPEVSASKYSHLLSAFPDLVYYSLVNGNKKLAAAWLIEQCGYKGFRRGDAGCYLEQPLVLVNYGNATGKEIYKLSEEISQSVWNKFNIELEREVNIII